MRRIIHRVEDSAHNLPYSEDPDATPEELRELEAVRPKTRGDCINGIRPCPFVGCRYHLFIDVSKSGNLYVTEPTKNIENMVDTCALDVADGDCAACPGNKGLSCEDVAKLIHINRRYVSHIELRGLRKLHSKVKGLLKHLRGKF